MRLIGSKIKLTALEIPPFVSGTILFESLKLSISLLESHVLHSALSLCNS